MTDPKSGKLKPTKTVSASDFYAYRIMLRTDDFNTLHRSGHLFHQFITDMFAKIEAERLNFIRFNQTKLRAEECIHLKDAIRDDKDTSEIGQLIILPSSFTGGMRYMHERTQDAIHDIRTLPWSPRSLHHLHLQSKVARNRLAAHAWTEVSRSA